jgi:hypothetical protein
VCCLIWRGTARDVVVVVTDLIDDDGPNKSRNHQGNIPIICLVSNETDSFILFFLIKWNTSILFFNINISILFFILFFVN